MAELCEEIGVERPHVAGNSLGGWTALEMAADGSVASVCAISPAGVWGKALGARAYDARRLGRRLRPAVLGAAQHRARTASLPARDLRPPGKAQRRRGRGGRSATGSTPPGTSAANDRDAGERLRASGGDRRPRDGRLGRARPARLARRSCTSSRPTCATSRRTDWGHTPTWDDPRGVAALLLEASAAEDPLPRQQQGTEQAFRPSH